ncbi:hypothetical protein RND71_035128 [Anisodus tanguticus]|uniref:NADH:quinone oxidoreductase/Mrp antiporter transmembrane domain-containing protein n=1 Tax=Anisodus tanguticus TaxID=243964 RepID=A0AAE1R6K0_9SOLA|nr:hypothetical protein RND71_035128 [Anisodus tanguticus]
MRLNAITLICILLFIGVVGKSHEIGSHTWSSDAMEGPTPGSALIHAATMVTSGVFMIASTVTKRLLLTRHDRTRSQFTQSTIIRGEQELGIGCGRNSRQWLRCSVDSLPLCGGPNPYE